MSLPTRSRQPRPEAQVAFKILAALAAGRGRETAGELQEAITRFIAVLEGVSQQTVAWGLKFDSEVLSEIAKEVRYGMGCLRQGQPFPYPLVSVGGLGEGVIWNRERGEVRRVAADDPARLFFNLAIDLLVEVGPWMRTCARNGCEKFFLYRRPKQAFCSDECAQEVRMARFRERQKAKVPKTVSSPARPLRDRRASAPKKR